MTTILITIRVLFVFLFATITQANNHLNAIRLSRRPFRLLRQRILASRRRLSLAKQPSPALRPMLSFRRPTQQSLLSLKIPLQAKFNHPTVGLTHPYFQSDWSCSTTGSSTASSVMEKTTHVASIYKSDDSNDDTALSKDEWWPSLLASPLDWRILKYRQTVGHGWDAYVKVRDAALQWEFATPNQGICSLLPSQSERAEIYTPLPAQSVHQISHGPGRRLMTFSRAPLLRFLFTINPVQVVYDVVDQMEYPVLYSSTAYATSEQHLLQGEERVTVAFRERTGQVQVELVSCSRPNGWKGKLVWPLLRKTQQEFFQQQMEALRKSAQE